jgi:CubicO group peptidase (beta-lactamase class C family)
MCARLASEQPLWESGTAIGESALFYGHLVGELVRRVDGRTPGAFLRDEVCGPLGLDFTIGLRDGELPRAAHLTGLDAPQWSPDAPGRPDLLRRALFNPPGVFTTAVVNSERFRRAEVPAINGHGTARAVAGLYAALLQGQLLSPALRDEASRAQASGVDRVMGGEPRSWGLGFAVDDDGWGMGGTGGSVGWACTSGGYAYGFVTGSMGSHDRSDAVENALRSVIGVPPL